MKNRKLKYCKPRLMPLSGRPLWRSACSTGSGEPGGSSDPGSTNSCVGGPDVVSGCDNGFYANNSNPSNPACRNGTGAVGAFNPCSTGYTASSSYANSCDKGLDARMSPNACLNNGSGANTTPLSACYPYGNGPSGNNAYPSCTVTGNSAYGY